MCRKIRDAKTSGRMFARAVIRDSEASWSRRDFMRVAWHEVPGRTPEQRPSRRDGLTGLFARGPSPRQASRRITKRRCTSSHRPYGTDLSWSMHQAINCLATFIQSLRDKGPVEPTRLARCFVSQCTLFEHESPFTSHFSLLTP
jgi:hypothetical protein